MAGLGIIKQHIKEWALDTGPVKIKGFALVAIGEDGIEYWGASYLVTEREQQQMARLLRIIENDIQYASKHGHYTPTTTEKE